MIDQCLNKVLQGHRDIVPARGVQFLGQGVLPLELVHFVLRDVLALVRANVLEPQLGVDRSDRRLRDPLQDIQVGWGPDRCHVVYSGGQLLKRNDFLRLRVLATDVRCL